MNRGAASFSSCPVPPASSRQFRPRRGLTETVGEVQRARRRHWSALSEFCCKRGRPSGAPRRIPSIFRHGFTAAGVFDNVTFSFITRPIWPRLANFQASTWAAVRPSAFVGPVRPAGTRATTFRSAALLYESRFRAGGFDPMIAARGLRPERRPRADPVWSPGDGAFLRPSALDNIRYGRPTCGDARRSRPPRVAAPARRIPAANCASFMTLFRRARHPYVGRPAAA